MLHPAVLGFADPKDDDLKARFNIDASELPMVMISPKPAAEYDYSADSFEWTRYEGGLKIASLASYLHTALPKVPFPQIDRHEVFEAQCRDKGGICFVGMLPDEPEDYQEPLQVGGDGGTQQHSRQHTQQQAHGLFLLPHTLTHSPGPGARCDA